jgi:prepilin-type N-terminal cleavage/methylation domain-containing protein
MKSQRGYGLVEFLVAVTITGILAVLVGVAVPQMTSVPEKGENQVDALHALQNVIHWVGFDAGSAKSAVGGGSLTLTMPDGSVISYSRTGNSLFRNSSGVNQMVAGNITDIVFTVESRLITMTITATPEGRFGINESRTFQVAMRPAAGT